jgi:hypothetical protein
MGLMRIAAPVAFACACAAAAVVILPRVIDAQALVFGQDDPVALTRIGLAHTFDSETAKREIEAALAADDADLARSFVELARDRNVELDPDLVSRVETANSGSAAFVRATASFGHGLVTGQPEDAVGLAGSALGDLFVFGDIRDVVREGARIARGEEPDELILGLAGVGLAVTAGTYASLGAGAPARVGITLAKVARRTGRLTSQMSEWLGRSLRQVVDWTALRGFFGTASLTMPAVAVRAARETVKAEKAEELMRLAGDVGRVQGKAGTRAAMDGLKIAEGPRDVSRLAQLAEVEGTRTRAILKTLGRSAILLTASAVNLFSWLLGAVMLVFGFIAGCKRTAERLTQYCIDRGKERRRRECLRFAAMVARN